MFLKVLYRFLVGTIGAAGSIPFAQVVDAIEHEIPISPTCLTTIWKETKFLKPCKIFVLLYIHLAK